MIDIVNLETYNGQVEYWIFINFKLKIYAKKFFHWINQ